MFAGDGYIGSPCVEDLRALSDKLNAQVVEQVNETQALVMMNKFQHETNEYQFQKSLRERISDIESWRWVLEDLSKRLDDSIGALRYEHDALRVVVQRVQGEINEHCREGSRPGALAPQSDVVEEAINQEYNFLRDQKKKFELMITELDKQIEALEKVKKRIENDVVIKQEAIHVDEECANIDVESVKKISNEKKKRKYSPVTRWQNRCAALKKKGLCALSNALITRQQVRGARTQLSVSAQSYAVKVDSALKRRLHTNTSKLEELKWQREEAIRDYKCLEEEMMTTEKNFLDSMEKERLMVARLADRTLRPVRELTRDDVDRKLRDELSRLRQYLKHMRKNIERITSLQNSLASAISKIECHGEDVVQIIRLDEERLQARTGEPSPVLTGSQTNTDTQLSVNKGQAGTPLTSIKEEDEDDDYPFDD